MNLFLKILAAIALIAVIAAASVVIIKHSGVSSTPSAPGNSGTGSNGLSRADSYRPDPRAKPQFTNSLDVADNPIQPAYKPINQPSYLQMLRQEGKTYGSIVLGKLTGRASKSDWGMQGATYFTYLYGLESTGKILKNDGVTIVEERTFNKVQEELLVSEYEVGIDLGSRIRSLVDLAESIGKDVGSESVKDLAQTVKAMDGTTLPIKKGWVDAARKAGMFTDFPQVDPAKFERELRMFTQGTNDRLLEGKTVRITFVDGQGIKTIEPVHCTLSEKERDVIIRSNFALDHYIFPDRQVSPGDDWTVDGDTFSSFLDPRLVGKAGGKVTILRTADFVGADGAISKKLKLTDGNIVVRETGSSQAVTGQLTGMKGVLTIPDAVHVVTSALLSGYADYQNVSTDHLLFEAKHTVKPKFEIKYQCSVE
jgi:hypothetical protein